jgi:hypothetical protein
VVGFCQTLHRTWPFQRVCTLLALLVLLQTLGAQMKLLAVLLLCSAAIAAASEVQQADPNALGGSCYQMPTCETPYGEIPQE